ncbi:DUF1254 domain-containing protein [Paraburkholderia sp. UCT31]|uniref:DUF1254 domain-containing protein n=1 Tax=Paraburkholderia sp. UCT31 TaxID=2615209 RepID=UPI00165658A8|nr:DUF1254 domain-containing protein [Paraburkholderia sp. UCT31]
MTRSENALPGDDRRAAFNFFVTLGIRTMTSRLKLRIVVPIAFVAFVGIVSLINLPYWLAFKNGVQAYLYAYPLITMDMTKRVMTAPAPMTEGDVQRKPGAGPANQFSHVKAFPDHTFKDVVAPNADTLYSIAWLDLQAEPMVLSMPDMHDRWVLMEVLDAWTNAFASLGTRQYGAEAKQYLISGPGWNGAVPDGMILIKSPTAMNWIIGRTYTRGPTDFAAVHQVQAQYHLVPLSRFLQHQENDAATLRTDLSIDTQTPVVTQVARLNAQDYFSRMSMLMGDNPPSPADAAMVEKLRHLGIEPGKPLVWKRMDPTTRRALEDSVWFVRALFDARSPGTQGLTDINPVERALFSATTSGMDKVLLNVRNGWRIPLNLGQYETRYPLRAIVSLVGLGANGPKDAVYPMTAIDAKGNPLTGEIRYVLHFDRDRLPPTKAFWSLTMYDDKMFFVDNSIRRYAIGDRDALHFNPDGSLDLWLQHSRPSDEKVSNWLPAPPGRFKLMLRLYDPKAEVLDGKWVPPSVQQLTNG